MIDDVIPISALQHFVFCPRQCAYIHLERVWESNYFTAKGDRLHERVHGHEIEKRRDVRTERGIQVNSEKLGIFGQLDLLEITSAPYTLTPVEYKLGKPKMSDCDRVQLCAQAMCLEEMCNVHISSAAIWYWKIRKRIRVELDQALRHTTEQTIRQTRELLLCSQKIPTAIYRKSCKFCSLIDHCQPTLKDSSAQYLERMFKSYEEITE